jgi:CRISPR-associated protein Cmr6
LPRPGERVEAVLLEEKTRKGGWRARHVATGIAGPIQNSNDVPDEIRPGKKTEPSDTVTLIVQSANEREIAFRYPTAADEQQGQEPQGKSKGGGQPPRGKR